MSKDTNTFYQEKPIFGLDIGFNSVKVMQIDSSGGKNKVVGYGVAAFDGSAISDKGIIEKHEVVAKAIFDLFKNKLNGEITTRRVCMGVPAGRTFARNFKLPKDSKSDIDEAVRLETEQYVPMAINDLYFDWHITSEDEKNIELLTVATPKRIIDSYLELAEILDLEVAAIETTTASAGRLFTYADHNDIPTILMDLGSVSSDITIYDEGLVVTGAVPGGGDSFTRAIAQKLNITIEEAHIVKTKYGLGLSKKQKEITEALSPMVGEMLKETRRIIRYFEERSGSEEEIGQIVTMGGGANMPGLSEHMTNLMRLPVRMCDPWNYLTFKDISPPNSVEKSMYVTVAGLALIDTRDIVS